MPLNSPIDQKPSRIDPLAFAAVAGTALACCPVTAILGFGLGIISYGRIKRSNGALRGRRIALACIWTSVFLGVASWIIGERIQSESQTSLARDVRTAVDQFLVGQTEPSAWWIDVDTAELLAFQSSVRAQIGDCATTSVTQTDVAVGSRAAAQYRLILESATIDAVASVSVDLVTDSVTFLPSIRIRSIEIASPSNPTLVFPAAGSGETPDILPTP